MRRKQVRRVPVQNVGLRWEPATAEDVERWKHEVRSFVINYDKVGKVRGHAPPRLLHAAEAAARLGVTAETFVRLDVTPTKPQHGGTAARYEWRDVCRQLRARLAQRGVLPGGLTEMDLD